MKKYLLVLFLVPLFFAAKYQIQNDDLLVGRDTPGDKSVEFQAGIDPNPRVFINQSTPESLRFSRENLIFGRGDTGLPDNGYSILFQQHNEPEHALPGVNFDGTNFLVREKTGEVWEQLATGYGLTRDENKFLSDTLRIDSRTDVPISDFGAEGHFLYKIGARSVKTSDYQTGTSVSHGNSAFPVLYSILIKDNFTILRFEDSQDSSTIAANLDTQNPISGYKRYMVTFPARADVGTYVAIVSEGQAEKYSFTSDLIINRNNLSTDIQNSLSNTNVAPPPPGSSDAHARFIQDLSYSLIAQESWSPTRTHPDYRPFHFHRLAAGFWGEDQTGATVTNYFDDVTGVDFSLTQTSGSTSAHFGSSTNWASHPSWFANTLTVTNSATGNHGGVELGTGDFVDWKTGFTIFPSIGLTRIADSGPANVFTNFNTDKKFSLTISGQNKVAVFRITQGTNGFSLITEENVGTLSLYVNGQIVGSPVTPQSSTVALNSTSTGNFLYLWVTPIDTSDLISFSSSNTNFDMELVNAENTISFGKFNRLVGGPFTNNFRRAVGFDFRLSGDDPSGIKNLLTIGNTAETVAFGGSSVVSKQMLLGYDELGTFVLVGGEDGAIVNADQISYLHKVDGSSPDHVCSIFATSRSGPISNNCNFNVNTPTSGTANLKMFIHFENSLSASQESSLPVTIVNRQVTIGTNSAASGQNITIPRIKFSEGDYLTETFQILSSYNGTNNQVAITTGSSVDSVLMGGYANLKLKISLVSVESTGHQANTILRENRVWQSRNEGETQSLVFVLRPEDNQSPDETDPFLTIVGEINGTPFSFDLNRRASEFDFSHMKLGNSDVDMSHVQVYSYDYRQNQVSDIYRANIGSGPLANNLYEKINLWLGLWVHPLEDIGEFEINDSVEILGELIAPKIVKNESVSGSVGMEFCAFSGAAVAVPVSRSCDWVQSSQRISTGTFRINIAAGTFAALTSCFIITGSPSILAGLGSTNNTTVNYALNSSSGKQNEPHSILCTGVRP